MSVTLLLGVVLAGCSGTAPPASEASRDTNPFLAPGPVVVQVDHVPGRAPAALALEGLAAVMEEVGTRPEIRVSATLAFTDGNHTGGDLWSVHRQTYKGDLDTWRDAAGVPVLHVLLVEGRPWDPEENHTTIGWSFRGAPLIALFPDQMRFLQFPLVSIGPNEALPNDVVLRSVLVHEYGHQLGLVGCGLPEVEPHGEDCHSRRQTSVMWPAIHTREVLQWILDDHLQPVWRFDDADWADIRAGQELLQDEGPRGAASLPDGRAGVDFKSRRTK